MTDKEIIKAEIGKRIEACKTKNGFPAGRICAIRIETYEELLSCIDSLQQEKPSESLEEAAEEYASDYPAYNDEQVIAKYAFKRGAEWQKAEMMKEAVEGEAEELYNDGESQCTVGVGTYFKPGEKVYVLKAEEEQK